MKNGEVLWQEGGCKLYLFRFGKLYTNTGVFINENSKEAFMIDSPYGSFEALKGSLLKNFSLKAVLITHAHWDHIGDDHLFQKAGTDIYVQHDGRQIIENPAVIIPYTGCSFGLSPCSVAHEIRDNEHLNFAGTDIRALALPGHSTSGMCFYIERAKVVFVGDTLFRDSIGRYDFVDGNKEQLISGIKEKILTLPADTTVVPGHGYLTTVQHESENNSFL